MKNDKAIDLADPPGYELAGHEAPPKHMNAAVRRRYGGPEVVDVDRIAIPEPGPGEVMVQVRAAGIDRGVVHLLTGLPLLVRIMGFGLVRPKQPVLGYDVAGRVVAIGSGVERLKVGDEVMGIADGSFAEYAVADANKLVVRPEAVSVDAAAVATISGITALQALTQAGRVQPGQRVLVVGASGGVGSFAVQIATALGARVTGMASAPNLDAVRSYGAVQAVDYRKTSVDEIGTAFDLIIDIGGRNSISRLRRALTPNGTLVLVGGEGGGSLTGGMGRNLRALMLSPFVSERLTMLISSESLESIEALVEMLEDGSVIPHVGARTDLSDVAAALARIERGGVVGKTLVAIGDAS